MNQEIPPPLHPSKQRKQPLSFAHGRPGPTELFPTALGRQELLRQRIPQPWELQHPMQKELQEASADGLGVVPCGSETW